MKRVAITGLGVIAPIGVGRAQFTAGLLAGKPVIALLSHPWSREGAPRIAAQVIFTAADHFSPMRAAMLDRTTMLALVAARQAAADAALKVPLTAPTEMGVYWGTGSAGANTIEESYRTILSSPTARLKPSTVVMAMHNAAAAEISLELGAEGPTFTYSTACSSSAIAIGEAFRAIRGGYVNSAIAGGADSLLTLGVMKAWQSLQTLAREDRDDPASSCRPFAKDRSGFVLGEGAGAVVLEDLECAVRRGATIHAEMVGFGATSDAKHITKPSVEGQARAMRQALAEAGLAPLDVGYVNAHGTATVIGDLVETQAIKAVFGATASLVPVSSTKAMHGHLMGATGAVEFIAALCALQARAIPPTANLRVPDPQCNLDYVANEARRAPALSTVMSNSFAFGGNNAVLVARRFA